MAAIKQLAKLRTGNLDTDRAVAHIADTLNPLLRTLPIPADFRFAEVAGLNGAAPTFQLQYKANNAQGWAGIATFTSAGLLAQPAWSAPSLLNGWSNYGAGNLTAGYYMDSLGIVHLRGAITNAAGTAANVNMLILPSAYRPSAQVNPSAQDVSVAAGALRRLVVDTSGQVYPTAAVAAGTIVSLDGISFDTR